MALRRTCSTSLPTLVFRPEKEKLHESCKGQQGRGTIRIKVRHTCLAQFRSVPLSLLAQQHTSGHL